MPAIRFGPYEVNLQTGELRKSGYRIRLQDKPFRILVALLEQPGTLVTRDELHKRLWPDDTFVDFDSGLNTALTKLRESLSDSAEEPRYIETFPRRGYRFMAPVSNSAISRVTMLAVMPFENLSGDKGQEYFSDGLTEEMITRLARLNPDRLGLIARTSSLRYKRTPRDIGRIARELSVDWILEGSVRCAGERVRITAQLVRTRDESHLWAQSYDRDLRDILAVQSEVALAVAAEIHLKLKPGAEAKSKETAQVNPEAHRACLMGCYHLAKFNREGLTRGIEYLLKSIELDPGYAPPYDDLAFSYFISSGWTLPPREAMLNARDAANRGLAVDANLADAHTSLGMVHLRYDWDWTAAERECRRAIEINAGSSRAHEFYGWYLAAMGRFDEAIERVERALELDPVSPEVSTILGHVLYLARRHDEAIAQLHKALELDRNYWFTHLVLGLALQQRGKLPEAIEEFQSAARAEKVSPEAMGALGQAYAAAGRRDQALKALNQLEKWTAKYYVSPFHKGRIHAALGQHDRAFEWFEKALEERSFYLSWFKVEPELDPLRGDPRFKRLLQRLSFPGMDVGV